MRDNGERRGLASAKMRNLRIEIISGYEAQWEDSRTHNQPEVESARRRACSGEKAIYTIMLVFSLSNTALNLFCFLGLVWNEELSYINLQRKGLDRKQHNIRPSRVEHCLPFAVKSFDHIIFRLSSAITNNHKEC